LCITTANKEPAVFLQKKLRERKKTSISEDVDPSVTPKNKPITIKVATFHWNWLQNQSTRALPSATKGTITQPYSEHFPAFPSSNIFRSGSS
jgi:hypothetical protein